MSKVNSPHSPLDGESVSLIDLAEAQLQQELRSMFAVDTQAYLQTYISLVQQLQPDSWTADIQELYRCVHTIKGGAVTVGADGILHVSTALEDLLSDLRYLQIAPPLADGHLAQMLSEAGELLTASLQLTEVGESALVAVQPTIERILFLRQKIQQIYLPESNERTRLFQEFAEQGFDLVVLDLEMALEQLPAEGNVSSATVNTAKQTLRQLLQIGKDLEFEQEWTQLLRRSQALLKQPENSFWQANWPPYLQLLKDCARVGGVQRKAKGVEERNSQLRALFSPVETTGEKSAFVQESIDLSSPQPLDTPVSVQPALTTEKRSESAASIQIPVSLERLDQSAQSLVETLLATRVSQGYHKTLQSQLVQLLSLAQESVQYVTFLRQVQDDYVLLDNLQSNRHGSTSPNLERYRQGYTVINRLLEASLRLSELGAEAVTTSRKTEDSFQLLDRKILNLRQTVEESRLIPFRTLAFRAKGILRDLTNRYGKPAQLVVHGEQIELDAGTVQILEPALLHLLRNAYDHGLETLAERVASGKPEQGTITLSLRRLGNSYLLDLQDDGRGINPNVIRQIAERSGLPLTRTDTPAELLAVICQPGFSSQKNVSEISGRGVGMDVVANQLTDIGGRLSLNTVLGAGTTFVLQIPVPHMLVRCVLVQAGDRTFAIPAEEIVTTTLWSQLSATQTVEPGANYSWLIRQDGVSVPGLDLLEYWQKGVTARPLLDTAVCLHIRSSSFASGAIERDAWLLADELLEQLDLLINPLPHPLLAPLGVMGVSLQIDGKLIPVLEPIALLEGLWTNTGEDHQFRNSKSAFPKLASYLPQSENTNIGVCEDSERRELSQEPVASATQTILVVDDAALVRRRIEASLTTYGYTIYTCNDGIEAWNWLCSHPAPAMLITDIEMPGMDGFTLISRCKQQGMKFPMLVTSSRLSEEWAKEARRLGATDYLTKGFTTSELINKVNSLISQ